MAGTRSHALLDGIVLAAWLCGCTAYAGAGFSVELIHRDSDKSPFHDLSLTSHGRVLAAVRRSMVRASAALARPRTDDSPHGAVAEVVSRPFDYLMYVSLGTPPTRMLAIADTGSDLVWLKCTGVRTSAPLASAPPSAVFDPSSSSTFGLVGCRSGACRAIFPNSCDASSRCMYGYWYADGSKTAGLLSTETFSFADAPGGCVGCPERPQLVVPSVNFGCSTATSGKFLADGVVGLGRGDISLVAQLGAVGRRFSYCLVPYSVNASSVLNFGARAAVTEPGAAKTPLVPSDVNDTTSYTVELESVKIGNTTLPHLTQVIIDSGSSLTYLDKALLDPMVEELTRRIKFPRKRSPENLLELCYGVTGATKALFKKNVPDVTLMLAVFGQAMTLKAENTFVEVQEGTMCLAMTPATAEQPFVGVIGNIAQQNFHVGFDLNEGTVTFAPADCASSYRWSSASVSI